MRGCSTPSLGTLTILISVGPGRLSWYRQPEGSGPVPAIIQDEARSSLTMPPSTSIRKTLSPADINGLPDLRLGP